MNISLAFSTCPNDTFMFDALVNQRIDTQPFQYDVQLADIFHLNQMAIEHAPDMVKISYNTYGLVMDKYELLDAGSALGHNCGPLLISKRPLSLADIVENQLTVAVPGLNTTANLLFTFAAPKHRNKKELIFHDIMPAILNDEVDAGVIIHENRFTYEGLGLKKIIDLGEHWESNTQLPIPLGAIVAKRSLGYEVIRQLESQLRASVQYAFDHPEASQAFVQQHAQELSPEVQKQHIDLYVNEYSLALGEKGRNAVDLLLKIGRNLGFYGHSTI
ncbi:MAG: 1,4-dihydroxy-6-naphthoate synthase [Bacteroidia bacterium]